jgi:hypothetical protein
MVSKKLADRMPSWTGSIRFRLTLIYSLLLFGLAAMVIGGMYLVLAARLGDQPVSRTFVMEEPVVTPQGIALQEERVQAEFQNFERIVNQRVLDKLRNVAFFALALLFLASLGVGWFAAGVVVAPIGASPAWPDRYKPPICRGGSAWGDRRTSCATWRTPSTGCSIVWRPRSKRSVDSSRTRRTSSATRSR